MEKEIDKKNNEKSTSELDADGEKKPHNEEIAEPTLEEKLEETQDKLLRSLADSENQRRRFEKETKEAFEYGGFNFARESLSLLDNLQRAHQSIKNDESLKDNKDLNKFLENIQIIEKDLVNIFEKNTIKKIDCLNQKFDPNNHQAMLEMEDENVEPGVVLQEIQPGYFFKDRLLRPSFVAVSKKKEVKNEENKEKNNDSTLVEK
jgi:molecular chaperone GrpE|tara:strand:- start:12 stop:626 length:615 start_codon:yes stop_codon:yes gene_type:complete